MTLLEPPPSEAGHCERRLFSFLFRFVLASIILQLWATVDLQIAIGISGSETGV